MLAVDKKDEVSSVGSAVWLGKQLMARRARREKGIRGRGRFMSRGRLNAGARPRLRQCVSGGWNEARPWGIT